VGDECLIRWLHVTCQRQPQVLAATLGGSQSTAGQPVRKIGGSGQVAAHRPGVENVDRDHLPTRDEGGQSTPDGLDLR
jgi:hypothetical protein